MASRASTLSAQEQGVRRAGTACAIGNFVEWYDYGIYVFIATVIAANFFAPGNPVAAMMGTFALFAVSFTIRPVGAWYSGGSFRVTLSSAYLRGWQVNECSAGTGNLSTHKRLRI